jgi:hypothetical protein
VLDARFAVDGKPAFQRDLTAVTSLAAADHDRIVVRCAHKGHLEFVPRHLVVTDCGHSETVAGCQFDGQLTEPGSSEVLTVLLAAIEVFHSRPDLISRSAGKPVIRRDHAVRPVKCVAM